MAPDSVAVVNDVVLRVPEVPKVLDVWFNGCRTALNVQNRTPGTSGTLGTF